MVDAISAYIGFPTAWKKIEFIFMTQVIEMNERKNIPEEKYFPDYVKAYMDKGAELLEQEYKYSKDIYKHLVELDKGI